MRHHRYHRRLKQSKNATTMARPPRFALNADLFPVGARSLEEGVLREDRKTVRFFNHLQFVTEKVVPLRVFWSWV